MKRRHLITVGLTVLTAIFLLVRAIIFLHPSPGDGRQKLRVRFESVEKIAPGTRVAFAGKPVGEVSSVTPILDVLDRSRQSAQIFPYEAILSIDSSVKVYRTDEIAVKTSGLMGERFIVITPKPFPLGTDGELVLATDILHVQPVGSADQAIQEISTVAQKADETMAALTDLIKDNQHNISSATQSFKGAAESLNQMLTGLNERHFAEKTSSCVDRMDLLAKKLTLAIDGNGTVGQLMRDSELYNNVVICLNEARQLMNDIDSYGLFFHTNRDWQREMSIRKETPVPQKFTNINSTLSQIESSLSQAKQAIESQQFTRDQKCKEDFIQHIKEIQKELDTLHDAIENLEIGAAESEDQKS